MNVRNAVPGIVMGLGGVLAAAGVVTFAMADEPDYADLSPVPESIVWHEGDDVTLWLATNRHTVDVRVSDKALGLGGIDFRDPVSGEAVPLGKGLGCLDAVVSSLEVSAIGASTATTTIRLDKDDQVAATAYYRDYEDGDPPSPGSSVELAASSTSTDVQVSGLDDGTKYRFDASTDPRFPSPITRSVTWTSGDADSGTTDSRVEEVSLIEGTGVELTACEEAEDVIITLHGDDAEELNRYLVDVLPAQAATSTPPADAGFVRHRVCVDDQSNQSNFLDGGEDVGDSLDASDFGLSGTLSSADLEPSDGNEFFFDLALTSGDAQLTVSDAGASELGLDADQVYPVVVKGGNGTHEARLTIGVWVDKATLSPSDDGGCS